MTTIEEIITRADAVRPNPFSPEQKTSWLAFLDGIIYRELISEAEDSGVTYVPHNNIHDGLLVDKPFDELYVLWLFSQMDLYLGEQARYNIDITAFQDFYNNYSQDYTDSHTMKHTPKILW